jgi:hypothetical protein
MRSSPGETPDSAAVSEASDALNAMVKHWQGSGIQIWKTVRSHLFPQPGKALFARGHRPITTTQRLGERPRCPRCRSWRHFGYSRHGYGIATGYNIGVQLDDGTFQWTTVNGAPDRARR